MVYGNSNIGGFIFYKGNKMNLNERIEKNTLTDLDKRMLKRHSKAKDFRRWEKVILVEDAITAAKEYAEEMCKKQKQICANYEYSRETILLAPLATEEGEE